eukprot:558478-Prymnesium_polylepis.2
MTTDQHRARVSSEAHRTVRAEGRETQRAPTRHVHRHVPIQYHANQRSLLGASPNTAPGIMHTKKETARLNDR